MLHINPIDEILCSVNAWTTMKQCGVYSLKRKSMNILYTGKQMTLLNILNTSIKLLIRQPQDIYKSLSTFGVQQLGDK